MMGQVMSPSATCIDLPSTYLNFFLLFLHSLIGARTRVVEYNYTPQVYTLGCALCYKQMM